MDRCNGFHHSTLPRTDARQQQQKAQPIGNWNQISQNNVFRNQTNQDQSNYGRNFNNENQRQQMSSNYNQQSGNQNRQSGSNSSTPHRGNWNKSGLHPQHMNAQNNVNRQQNNNQRTVAQQQAATPQQNYTCSNQQETSWIRPQIQLQAIPVTLFNRDLCIEPKLCWTVAVTTLSLK